MQAVEERREHHVVREVLARNLPRGRAVALGGGENGIARACRLLEVVEREEAFARREVVAESRLGGHDGTAGGQIGGTAIAEPPASEARILLLGNRELGERSRDVVAIAVQGRELGRRPY